MYTHKKRENHIKRILFSYGKKNGDVRQDEKHVPDLLESIMRPIDPVKDELRQKLSKIDQFASKIKQIRACTFQMSGKNPDLSTWPSRTPFLQYLAPLGAKNLEKGRKILKNRWIFAFLCLFGRSDCIVDLTEIKSSLAGCMRHQLCRSCPLFPFVPAAPCSKAGDKAPK